MQFLTSVIVLSCVYAILASGFVVIYKSSRILNFAYADVVMLIGYFSVTMFELIGGLPIVSLAMVLLLSFIFGLVIYALLIRPMAGQPIFSTIILTVALGIILQAFTILVWRGELESISLGWRQYYTLFKGARIASTEIVIIVTTLLFFISLSSFYHFSRIGQQMRATAENTLLAAQRGINIYFVTALAWAIGIFATGIASILLGSNYSVSLYMGHVAIKAFSVALVGGLDSIKGIIPAAFVVALAELTASNYINPRLADTMPFIIMLMVLLIRPWGFWGTEEEIERV
jgi:branched-chain amino acid transport system permease protein